MSQPRDHGGGLDAAVARWGGERADWIDLSTGINPVPYPVGEISPEAWTALPDNRAMERLLQAARTFWNVPEGAEVVAANGASAIISAMPRMRAFDLVYIPGPTYNEHAAAFELAEWIVLDKPSVEARAQVFVHPNNPDGRLADPQVVGNRAWTIVDESFCDVMPEASFVARTDEPGVMVLKSLGKFWGLAGLRLGFAIGHPKTLHDRGQSQLERWFGKGKPVTVSYENPALADLLGPWSVSGPALEVGARALADRPWAAATRARLAADAVRLDRLMARHGQLLGGTDLFRLYAVEDALAFQAGLAERHIWSRVFPYSETWLRLGLPAPHQWERLEAAL
ncbi:threonine-phosphate decarboxylase [Marimonas arenosa]|uniref:Aminotransferase n=1 Tax=Marimonas arenosa TaxID=1795305 RepID=A0AAE4B473_9RHOB|nr:threonine-phosphate decarboxylase [Marimonas arenosa]MDQ2090768.1 pyridoxal phosphate-dependent class II aminotransferase [Marimonas arenosa]